MQKGSVRTRERRCADVCGRAGAKEWVEIGGEKGHDPMGMSKRGCVEACGLCGREGVDGHGRNCN